MDDEDVEDDANTALDHAVPSATTIDAAIKITTVDTKNEKGHPIISATIVTAMTMAPDDRTHLATIAGTTNLQDLVTIAIATTALVIRELIKTLVKRAPFVKTILPLLQLELVQRTTLPPRQQQLQHQQSASSRTDCSTASCPTDQGSLHSRSWHLHQQPPGPTCNRFISSASSSINIHFSSFTCLANGMLTLPRITYRFLHPRVLGTEALLLVCRRHNGATT